MAVGAQKNFSMWDDTSCGSSLKKSISGSMFARFAGGSLFEVDRQERLGPLGVGGLTANVLDEAAVGIEDYDSLVAPVGYVNIPFGIDRDTGRPVKLAVAAPGAAEGRYKLAVKRELLNAVVLPVGDVQASVRADREAPWEAELSFAGTQ